MELFLEEVPPNQTYLHVYLRLLMHGVLCGGGEGGQPRLGHGHADLGRGAPRARHAHRVPLQLRHLGGLARLGALLPRLVIVTHGHCRPL